ncbi:MAG: murein L,D-transpeptidase catalytic domain family protein [Chitinophagaceae bacterium]|nr:murein L,D-transpeptidase catalytic domain family protein [Chitinophagaceae bacterium]
MGILLIVLSPILISGTSKQEASVIAPVVVTISGATPSINISTSGKLSAQADALYDSMKLKRAGLSKKAFEFAWKGYQYMLSRKLLRKTDVLSICDFSQSSRRKRLYIIDLETMKLLINTHVAHGRNSGNEFAKFFSNSEESHKSSLGFYVTRNTYWGGHGLSLQIEGLERGINDKANERKIVVHGSDYVGDRFLRSNPFNGRSFGCPAVPSKLTTKVINTIKNGSCFFIYHPTKNYISKSRILNG